MTEMLVKLGIDWTSFIGQLVNFIILFLALRFLAWGPITQALEERRLKIEKGLKDADSAARKLQEIEKEKDEALSKAQTEAMEILDGAKKQSAQLRAEKLALLDAELAKNKIESQEQLENERQETYNLLKNDIAKLVTAATGKLVEGMDGKVQAEMVKTAIKDVEKA